MPESRDSPSPVKDVTCQLGRHPMSVVPFQPPRPELVADDHMMDAKEIAEEFFNGTVKQPSPPPEDVDP